MLLQTSLVFSGLEAHHLHGEEAKNFLCVVEQDLGSIAKLEIVCATEQESRAKSHTGDERVDDFARLVLHKLL